MQSVKIYAIVLLLAFLTVEGQTQQPAIPKPIRAMLDAKYPGWTLASVSPSALEHYRFHQFESQPNFLWGDFDGDGRRDYAFAIDHPGQKGPERVVVAFLRRSAGFHAYSLESHPANDDVYLWPHHKGEQGFDFHLNKEFAYSQDGIGVVYGEVAGVSYVFENGAFRKIISSD